MKEENKRRSFLKKLAIGGLGTAVTPTTFLSSKNTKGNSINEKLEQIIKENGKRKFNTEYKGEYLNRVAFPIGGIGAGMFFPTELRLKNTFDGLRLCSTPIREISNLHYNAKNF